MVDPAQNGSKHQADDFGFKDRSDNIRQAYLPGSGDILN